LLVFDWLTLSAFKSHS